MPWMTRQGTVEAFTCGGADAYLLEKDMDGRLVSAEFLRKSARVRLACILSADEALHNLVTVSFVASQLFSVARRHASAVAELLCIVDRLEELHTKV